MCVRQLFSVSNAVKPSNAVLHQDKLRKEINRVSEQRQIKKEIDRLNSLVMANFFADSS